MKEWGVQEYRGLIFLSVILSPMMYLVPAAVIDTMWPPPLHGLVFSFGSITWYSFPNVINPIQTRHLTEFSYFAMLWFLVGVYMISNFPHKSGEKLTIAGHITAFILLILAPYLLFVDYTIVKIIPLPIPPILSLLFLGIYVRNNERIERSD
ncbi:MAG: hypothetical protein ACW98Y_06785 [Candidatus Thorarchaeota archaeon]|jgi:phosphatidylserine synthase